MFYLSKSDVMSDEVLVMRVEQRALVGKFYLSTQICFKGSSMTKKSEIPHTRRKVPDFGKQEETLEETKNPQF